MDYVCQAKTQPAKPVLSVRTRTGVTSLPNTLRECFTQIEACLSEQGEAPSGAPYVAYFNMDMNNLDIEVGFPVSRPLLPKGNIRPGSLPAGTMAVTTHTGSYQSMEQAYKALTRWMTANHFQPSGTVYEFYLNDPTMTPPDELKTEIVFPVQRVGE